MKRDVWDSLNECFGVGYHEPPENWDETLPLRSDGTLSNSYSLHAGYSGTVFVVKFINGVDTLLASGNPASFVTGVGNWNNLSVDVGGTSIDVYINGIRESTNHS